MWQRPVVHEGISVMDEAPKPIRKHDPNTIPCPICGETNYRWGTPGAKGGVYYVPEGGKFILVAVKVC